MGAFAKGRAFALVLVAAGAAMLGSGCGGSSNNGDHEIWFMGAIIDGASGKPITADVAPVEVTLVFGQTTKKGKVDGTTGRFVLGPLKAWNDYGVLITAGSGYRSFSSYNAMIPPPAPPATSQSADIYTAHTTQTFNFDAYLFPTSIPAPDVSVTLIESGPNPAAAMGTYRLQPTTLSSQPNIISQASEVGGQVWANDNDLFAGVISNTFTAGQFTVTGDQLVYGVNYDVVIYGVDGYQPATAGTQVRAGVTSQAMITLVPQTVTPLQMIANTIATCRAPLNLTDTTSAQVTLTFNKDVMDATTSTGGAAEVLDTYFIMYDTLFTSSLATNSSPTTQERGTTFTINGPTINLAWDPNTGLAIKGSGDTISQVVYSNLSLITLQPTGHPELRTSLATLINTTQISCAH
jgi:hypothetical protein